jgi:AraC-like DNA-binding protein
MITVLLAGKQALFGNPVFEYRIASLKNIPSKNVVDSVRSILFDLTLGERDDELYFCRKLLEMRESLEVEGLFFVKRHYAKIAPENNQHLLDEVISYARRNKLDEYISSVYVLKSELFKQQSVYDSAMIYILLAGDEANKFGNIEQKANVLHLLGDLYYSTGYYRRAGFYYEQVQQVKGNLSVWNDWRERVIWNNLALIEKKTGNFQNALDLFDISLKALKNHSKNKPDSMACSYINFEKAFVYFDLNELQHALNCLDLAEPIFKKHNEGWTLLQINMLRAKIALKENNILQATEFFEKTLTSADTSHISRALKNEIILLKSEILAATGDYEKSLLLMRQYTNLNDKLLQDQTAAQLLQIQSENEYGFLQKDFSRVKTHQLGYILLASVTSIALIIITYLFSHLNIKNKKLVALVIHSVNQDTHSEVIVPLKVKLPVVNTFAAEPDISQQQLIADFKNELKNKEIYLQHNFTLQRAAELTGTNRTYLSKAINDVLKQNFSAYINELRINEAIRQISSKSNPKEINVSGLASEVGFGSRTSFIAAFTKKTGMLPSTFIANYKEMMNTN